MIRKKELLEAINDLSRDLTEISIRTYELEKKVRTLERKEKVNATTQPRDKSGCKNDFHIEELKICRKAVYLPPNKF